MPHPRRSLAGDSRSQIAARWTLPTVSQITRSSAASELGVPPGNIGIDAGCHGRELTVIHFEVAVVVEVEDSQLKALGRRPIRVLGARYARAWTRGPRGEQGC